jgi:hypothetical protein
MPLDTSIARSIKPLQIQFRDLGADYNQLAQMQSAESQNQLAQQQMQERQQLAPLRLQEQQSRAATAKIELDDVMEAQTYVKGLMNKAAEASGGSAPTDPFAAAEQMFNHPNPMVRSSGEQLLKSLQILQTYKNQRDYEASRQPGVGAAPTVPVNATTAPSAVAPFETSAIISPASKPYAEMSNAEKIIYNEWTGKNRLPKTSSVAYTLEGQEVPFSNYVNANIANSAGAGERAAMAAMPNALALAASAEPVANAMVRPINPLQDAAALLKKIQEGDNQFARGGTPAPGWKNDRELLVKAYEQALKPGRNDGQRYISLGAGKALDQDTGQIISADRVPAAAATAKILKIGNVPYTLDAEGTLVPTPIQGGLPISGKGAAAKVVAGAKQNIRMLNGVPHVLDMATQTWTPMDVASGTAPVTGVTPGGAGKRGAVGVSDVGVAGKGDKAPTEGERKAATLLQRLQFSQSQLTQALVDDPNAAKPGVFTSAVAKLSTPLANALTPESQQRVKAAQLDMLDAALTLGTGAAYTKEQLEGYREAYFPQIGDKPQQIRDKQQRLENVISAARIAAGRAEKLVPSAPAVSSGASDLRSAADKILGVK